MSAALTLLPAVITPRDRSVSSCPQNNQLCPGFIIDHAGDYVSPLVRHVELVLLALAFGFPIAFVLAILAYRRRWLVGPVTAVTGILYTLPSIAVFFLLQPITGRGIVTATIALTSYTLLILFRNILLGLDNVPAEIKDAARGQGLNVNQQLRQVELPLALPEIVAGLRIAATTTVGLATLAFLAGAGGLGEPLFNGGDGIVFKGNVVFCGLLCVALAAVFDLVLLAALRVVSPWRRATAS